MFQGLNTALTSLYSTRQALETTGNNIANVNTEGYTRQRVELESINASRWGSFFSASPKSGIGVTVTDIARLRDQFLESRGVQEHGTQGKYDATKSIMETVELAFGEPGDTGLQSQLAEYWGAWDDVANRPDDPAARSQVIEQAQTLVAVFGQTANSLTQLADASLAGIKNDVNSLNSMAQSVADLNKAIKTATNAGVSPNDLLDKRDLLIGKMAELGGVTVQKLDSGSVAVNIGGVAVVRDEKVTRLEVDDSTTPVVLRWDSDGNSVTTTDGYPATITGGKIGGTLEAINSTIPSYRNRLDQVASDLITKVNAQHNAGLDASGTAGVDFFTGTNATNIAVNPTLAANSALLAARASGSGELDGENARAIANFATALTGPDATYREMIDHLGVEAQRSYNQASIQQNITNSIDASRESVAGVNLDEEMTNLIRFQKGYSASAQYISVLNQTLDSLLSIVR